jgi:hypothetical protein
MDDTNTNDPGETVLIALAEALCVWLEDGGAEGLSAHAGKATAVVPWLADDGPAHYRITVEQLTFAEYGALVAGRRG